MTVCAGFLCDEGVIVGADTEMSGGVKYHASKLRREKFTAGEYVITGTGSAGYIGMAADMIEEGLYLNRALFRRNRTPQHKRITFQRIIRMVSEDLQKYIKVCSYGGVSPSVELILGVRFNGKGSSARLMNISEDGSVAWKDHHITAGTGADIALRFLTILSSSSCPYELMRSIAFFCLEQAKLGAEGVGGETHLMRLPRPNRQTVYSPDEMVKLGEQVLRLSVAEARDRRMSKEIFDSRLQEIVQKINAVREATKQQAESETMMLQFEFLRARGKKSDREGRSSI